MKSEQRHSKSRPCPICGGYPSLPRGHGVRCHGFLSDDGQWAHCTRPERSGQIDINESIQAYAHRLSNDCLCGIPHNTSLKPKQTSGVSRKISATYDYLDEASNFLSQTVRYIPKGFSQRRPDGNGGWIWNLKNTRMVLYKLPELLTADPSNPVFIVEGEKDVDSLRNLNLTATTNPLGSGKWLPEFSHCLTGRDVVILPHNDEAGSRHTRTVVSSIRSEAKSVRVIELEGRPPKGGDVSDWLGLGHTAEELIRLVEESSEYILPDSELASQPSGGQAMRSVRLIDVEPEDIRWLWPGYIPIGKLTILAGDPGLGKSWLALDLAARVTVGSSMPDCKDDMDPGTVVLLTAEDGLADTIRPRIDSQNGDANKIHAITDVVGSDGKDRLVSLMKDINDLEIEVASHGARLLVIDPLNAYMDRVEGNADIQVRQVLTPLSKMAERTGVAILVIMHLNKDSTKSALYRVLGSGGYVGAARSVLMVASDKKHRERRVLGQIKSNLGKPMPGLYFTVNEYPALEWLGQAEEDISELLGGSHSSTDRRVPLLEEAKRYLIKVLEEGPVPKTDIEEESELMGIRPKTLFRAKNELRIVASPVHSPGNKGVTRWEWSLPDI